MKKSCNESEKSKKDKHWSKMTPSSVAEYEVTGPQMHLKTAELNPNNALGMDLTFNQLTPSLLMTGFLEKFLSEQRSLSHEDANYLQFIVELGYRCDRLSTNLVLKSVQGVLDKDPYHSFGHTPEQVMGIMDRIESHYSPEFGYVESFCGWGWEK